MPRKRSTKSKSKGRKTTPKKSKAKKQSSSNAGIYIVISIFISFIMILSLYIDSDALILRTMRNSLQILFGIGGYIAPAAIIIMVLLYHFNKEHHKRNMIAGIAIFIFLLVILDVNLLLEVDTEITLKEKINTSMEIGRTGFGGGIVGGFFAYILIKLFDKEGTILVSVFTIVLSSIVIANKSIIEIVRSFLELLSKLPSFLGKAIDFIKTRVSHLSEVIKTKNNIRRLEREAELKELKKLEERKKNMVRVSSSNDLNEENKIKREKQKKKEPIIINGETGEFEFEVVNRKDENNLSGNDVVDLESMDSNDIKKSVMEKKKDDENQNFNTPDVPDFYEIPPIDLLSDEIDLESDDRKHVLSNADKLIKTLSDFGIEASIESANIGPSITKYELQIAPGVKVSRILNLSNDIALSLASSDIRIEAPIPGKSAIGIEIPNKHRTSVRIRQIIESPGFKNFKGTTPIALGKDVEGNPVIADIEKTPHMLIAGATGSGKSVCINTIITSIIYKSSPEEVKLILIDPKVVELSIYNGIPHLYIPVVTDPNKAAGALNWAVSEMNRRYKAFADEGVRDIGGYNRKAETKLPKIVMIIDELSDLMMTSSSTEVEEQICRIAQMARAAGIHMIIATQRPSVDVITGTIKANIPTRISFAVSSQTDSRTILDMAGAEKLLGRGDMLFSLQSMSKPQRIQGAYIDDEEVERLVNYLKSNNEVEYEEEIIDDIEKTVEYSDDDCDELLPEAINLVIDEQQASTSFLQRRLKIGYSRAARIMDQMQERNIVGELEGNRGRKVLLTREDIDQAEEYDERS